MPPHPARAPAPHRELCGTLPCSCPGVRVFLGAVGCRADLLIVLFNSYLQIPFLTCSNYQREMTAKTSVWSTGRARGCPNAVMGKSEASPRRGHSITAWQSSHPSEGRYLPCLAQVGCHPPDPLGNSSQPGPPAPPTPVLPTVARSPLQPPPWYGSLPGCPGPSPAATGTHPS